MASILMSFALKAILSARVNLRRAQLGNLKSLVLLYDRTNLCYALAVAGYNSLANCLKTMEYCSCFLEQATRPMEEFPEGDRDFVKEDREFWTADRQIQKMESLLEECIRKIDLEMGGQHAI